MPSRSEALKLKLTVIIPAFDEEAGIFSAVRSLRAHLPQADVLVVDDGSTDQTALEAMRAGAKVISQCNQGHGAALLQGARAAQSDWLLFLDADDEIDLSRLGAHWLWVQKAQQPLFGVRKGRRQSFLRYLLSRVLALRTGLEDANCPYKFVPRKAVLALPETCQMPLLALSLSVPEAHRVPVYSTKARQGRLSFARLLRLSLAALREIRTYS